MENLLGTDMPLAIRFLVAFMIVLALIGLTFWLIRRFGGTRVGTATARGRQPRLAVIDAAPVDGRRRLVLIRRDNVEHLLLIGGPSDVVVEQNIIRAVPVSAPREMPVARAPGAAEAIATRAANDSARTAAFEDTSWPAPEPAPRGEAHRGETRPARSDFLPRPPRNFEPRPESRAMEPRAAEPRAYEPSARSTYQPAAATARPLPAFEPQVAPPPIVPESAPALDTRAAPPDDALASMAQRLEAALRRPMPANGRPDEPDAPRPAPAADATAHAEPATAAAPADAPASAQAEAKPARSKTVLDNLEEEMASLLGRPERPERKDPERKDS